MLALTIFIAALLIFIAFFSQSMQTAITYQQHNSLSTKTSDILDTVLLNPGLPMYWGQNDTAPAGFGLQDPGFNEYTLSSFAPLRLSANSQPSVHYTAKNAHYNNLTAGLGSYILTPIDDGNTKSLTYKRASELLGINGTYGFQLTLTPTVDIWVNKTSAGDPLQFLINATGSGFALANANITYSLIVADEGNQYPSWSINSSQTTTDAAGFLQLTFPGIDGESRSYALIVYSYLYGLKGMGYYVHVPSSLTKTVVPIVESFQNHAVRLAHSNTVGVVSTFPPSELSYNTSFAIVTEEYTLRQVNLDPTNATGKISNDINISKTYKTLTLPVNDPGILLVAYKDASSGQVGIELVPWGLGSLALPVSFGGNSAGHDWVTTDIRQVTIGGIAYQAKLDLWSLQGHGGSS
jgi:hypothetical protein